jgi:HD-like signal output (HDOD) protein
MDSPTGRARELVEVIELDAGLAASVLRLANSALYGHVGKVDTLGRAITVIGHQSLRDLVVATSTVKAFHDIPVELVDMDTFWDNSITCAVLSKLLAQQARLPEGEVLFLGGLFHGIGRLVLYAKRPEQYREVLQKARVGDSDLVAAERQVFGFTYADVGAALLTAWKLPEKLQVVVGHHLDPTQAPRFAPEVAVVHLASQLTDSLAPCLKTRKTPSPYTPNASAAASMETLGLTADNLDEIHTCALSVCLEVIEIMRPGAGTIF